MSTEMKKQCSNCLGWYTNLKGLKNHLRHCNKSAYSEQSEELLNHIANPMLSICLESNGSFGLKEQISHGAECLTKEQTIQIVVKTMTNMMIVDIELGGSYKEHHIHITVSVFSCTHE